MISRPDVATRKASVRSALGVVSALTLQGLAHRMGLAGTTLYHYAHPQRDRSPSPTQVRQLAGLLREDAARLIDAAALLERTALTDAETSATDPHVGPDRPAF